MALSPVPWNSKAKQEEVIAVSLAPGIVTSAFPFTSLVPVVGCVILSDPWSLPTRDWRPP